MDKYTFVLVCALIAVAGKYYLIAQVDPAGKTGDKLDDNNFAAAKKQLTVC